MDDETPHGDFVMFDDEGTLLCCSRCGGVYDIEWHVTVPTN